MKNKCLYILKSKSSNMMCAYVGLNKPVSANNIVTSTQQSIF